MDEDVFKRITIEVEEFNLRFAMTLLRNAKSQIKWAWGQGLLFVALGLFHLVFVLGGNPWYMMSTTVYAAAGVFFIWWARKRWLSEAWRALRKVADSRIALKKAMTS